MAETSHLREENRPPWPLVPPTLLKLIVLRRIGVISSSQFTIYPRTLWSCFPLQTNRTLSVGYQNAFIHPLSHILFAKCNATHATQTSCMQRQRRRMDSNRAGGPQPCHSGSADAITTTMRRHTMSIDGHRPARIQKLRIDINVSTTKSKTNCRRNPNHGQWSMNGMSIFLN